MLDPASITIGTTTTNDNALPSIAKTDGTGPYAISVTALGNSLASGNVELQATGDITFSTAFTSTATNKLTLTADGTVYINVAVDTAGTIELTVTFR